MALSVGGRVALPGRVLCRAPGHVPGHAFGHAFGRTPVRGARQPFIDTAAGGVVRGSFVCDFDHRTSCCFSQALAAKVNTLGEDERSSARCLPAPRQSIL